MAPWAEGIEDRANARAADVADPTSITPVPVPAMRHRLRPDKTARRISSQLLYRWVQRYAPEIEKRLRWQWRRPCSTSWRLDETYVKVRGKWAYLYSARESKLHA